MGVSLPETVTLMGKLPHLKTYMSYGLSKMTGVAIILMGTGTIIYGIVL